MFEKPARVQLLDCMNLHDNYVPNISRQHSDFRMHTNINFIVRFIIYNNSLQNYIHYCLTSVHLKKTFSLPVWTTIIRSPIKIYFFTPFPFLSVQHFPYMCNVCTLYDSSTQTIFLAQALTNILRRNHAFPKGLPSYCLCKSITNLSNFLMVQTTSKLANLNQLRF